MGHRAARWGLWWWLAGLVAAGPAPAQTAKIKLTEVTKEATTAYKVRARLEADTDSLIFGAAQIGFDLNAAGDGYVLLISALKLSFARREKGVDTPFATVKRSLGNSLPARLVVSRDAWRMGVTVNGEMWLTACADPTGGHTVAIGTTGPTITLNDPLVQGTEPIWFADDFMRTPEQSGDWAVQTGTWECSGVSQEDAKPDKRPDPTKSANPFAYRAVRSADGALVTAGHWFWDTYRAEVSVRATSEAPRGLATIGICGYLQDRANYLAFEWRQSGARDKDGRSVPEQLLVAVKEGQRTVLASARAGAIGDGRQHFGWAEDQWYRLGLQMVDNQVTAFVDEQPVLSASCELYGQGSVGLYANGVAFADFDDVAVQSTDAMSDDFTTNTLPRWQTLSGTWTESADEAWKVRRGENPAIYPFSAVGALRLASNDSGVAVTGSPEWTNYKVTAAVKAEQGGVFGVVACCRDPRNYMLLRWGDNNARAAAKGSFQLVRIRDGKEQVVWHWDNVPFKPALAHWIALEARQGYVRAWCENQPIFETYQPDLTTGKIGVAAEGKEISFDGVKVDFLPPYEKPEFTEQFTKEDTMVNWASPVGSWVQDPNSSLPQGVLWHRGRFYGDGDVTVNASLVTRALTLVYSGDGAAPQPATNGGGGTVVAGNALAGYSLLVVPTAQSPRKAILELRVDGKPVRRSLGSGGVSVPDGSLVRLSRRGNFLLGYVGDNCVVSHYDNRQPTEQHNGPFGGIAFGGGDVGDLANADIHTTDCFDTTFVKAPWEWRTQKGLWETVNRWKCDPRWSFMGGYHDTYPQNPLMWTKADFGGDVQVEAYMAIKMDVPGDPYYYHPSDLGITVCGDGKDILSGYSFLFAARGNGCSLLYQKGQGAPKVSTVDGSTFEYVNPKGEGLTKFHRHWFHLVVRRTGGRVQCFCDNKPIFDEPDTARIPSGKVALFCVNNGTMVSRVKVWHSEDVPRTSFPDVGGIRATADLGAPVADDFANDFEQGVGNFAGEDPRGAVMVSRTRSEPANGSYALALTNMITGGRFAVKAIDRKFDVAERPRLSFRYKIPPNVQVNCYLRGDIRGDEGVTRGWYVLTLNGDPTLDKDQRLLVKPPVTADGRWHQLSFDLADAFKKAGAPSTEVTRVVFGLMLPDSYPSYYTAAGFNDTTGVAVNPFGATWWLDDFSLGR